MIKISFWVRVAAPLIVSISILFFIRISPDNPYDAVSYKILRAVHGMLFGTLPATDTILLLQNSEGLYPSYKESTDFLFILKEAGIDSLFAPFLLDESNNTAGAEKERRDALEAEFSKEFSLMSSNVSKLFDAIKYGSVRPKDASALLSDVLVLLEGSKERLFHAAVNNSLSSKNALHSVYLSYGAKRAATTIEGLGLSIPKVAWAYPYPQYFENAAMLTKRVVDIRELSRYALLDANVYKALRAIEEGGYITDKNPEAHPAILYEYALSLRRDIETSSNEAVLALWLKTRSEYEENVKKLLARPLESDQHGVSETGAAAFLELRNAADTFFEAQHELKQQLGGSVCVMTYNNELSLEAAALLKAAMEGTFIYVLHAAYVRGALLCVALAAAFLYACFKTRGVIISAFSASAAVFAAMLFAFEGRLWIHGAAFFIIVWISAFVSISFLFIVQQDGGGLRQ